MGSLLDSGLRRNDGVGVSGLYGLGCGTAYEVGPDPASLVDTSGVGFRIGGHCGGRTLLLGGSYGTGT